MKKIWYFFLNKKSFSYLLVGALVVFGLNSAVSLPRESNPEVQIPIAIVTTILPGGSALDVEKLVTNKIEEALSNNLDELNKLSSSSKNGVSSVTVEFNADADIAASIQDVKDEVDKIKTDLPEEAEDPIISEINFVNEPIMILAVSSDLPVLEFIKLSNDLEDELNKVKGVSRVSKSGIAKKEVQVVVKKDALRNFSLNISDVVFAISRANSSLPVGSIEFSDIEYSVKFDGDIKDPSSVKDIAILNKNGESIYVRDLAFVSDGVDKSSGFSRISLNGIPSEQAVSFAIFKKTGGDVTKITQAVKDRVEELKKGMLKGSSTLVFFDTGEVVKKDLSNLTQSGLQTVAFVMLILFVVIGWREALIAGLAIPMSFLVAFIGLYASGNSINFVSLFSLILSVGILVDSAIVITEGVHTNILSGLSRRESAKKAIAEFQWPLISGTMTTVAVFAPLFFISGVTGQFIAVIPFTIIFVLLASLFVALAIIPLFASVLFRKKEISENKLLKKQEDYTNRVQIWYKEKLNNILNNKRKENYFFISLLVAFILALALPATGVVKTIFFAQEDADFIFIEIEKPEGTILSKTDLSVREVEEYLYNEPFIESFVATTGKSSSFNDNSVTGEKYGNITVILKDNRKLTSSEILTKLSKKLEPVKSADISLFQANNGPPTGAPVFIQFFGDDLDQLAKVALRAENILNSIEGTNFVKTSNRSDGLEFVLEFNEAKAAELGINPSVVAQILRTSIFGTKATVIKNEGEDRDVVVKLNLNTNYQNTDETNKTNIDSIRYMEIQSPFGPIILDSLVDVSIKRSSARIDHEERKRMIAVSSELKEGFTATQIISEFKQKTDDLNLPDGVTFRVGGEAEDVDQSFKDMFIALITGMVLVLSILVLQFNSYRYAIFIISVVPFSFIGIFFGLAISGNSLSFPSIMGYIALSGIVVNNSIILIDVMNKLRKKNPERSIQEIVIEGASSRLRPILLTTITTIIGVAPLIYVAEIWAPLAFAIIFGLSFAVIITLLLVPVLYNRWPGKQDKKL